MMQLHRSKHVFKARAQLWNMWNNTREGNVSEHMQIVLSTTFELPHLSQIQDEGFISRA